MKITKILVVVLLLVARICRDKVIMATPSPNDSTSSLDQMVVEIVTSCYQGRIDAVGLVGNVPASLTRTLSVQHLIPVVLIDDVKKTFHVIENVVSPKFHHKLHLFIVDVSSHEQFNATIQLNIEFTIWKNHMAQFFMLDRSPRCSNAEMFLIIAWQLSLLNTKVICFYDKVGTITFDYNPYTGRAPISWRLLREYLGINKHPFKVFYRIYGEKEAMCSDLDFDKTKDSGGYQISVEGVPIDTFIRMRPNIGFYEASIAKREKRVVNMIYRTLNVTPKYTGVYRKFTPENIDLDVRRNWIINQDTLKTYPHKSSRIVIVTQFRGHKSQLNKILSVVDVESRFGIGIVYLITLLFLKIVVHQALVPGLLNLIRITCNTGLTNIPNDPAPRVYVAGLLFFVVTMQGIYQGNLASLLTNKIPLRNVNTMEDLLNWGYKLYGAEGGDGIIEHPGLKARFIVTDSSGTCITNVAHDSSAACLECAEGYALDLARKFDLHLSTKFVKDVYVGYEIRKNWPLEHQINVIFSRMVEADILEPWDVKCNPVNLADFEFDKDVKQNTEFKIIELQELIFAFVILVTGLVFAAIIFILEVVIYSYSTRIVTVRVQVLN